MKTNDDYMEFVPDWNHDGTKIVYMADANKRRIQDIANGLAPQYHILTMDANGTNEEVISSFQWEQAPAWVPVAVP